MNINFRLKIKLYTIILDHVFTVWFRWLDASFSPSMPGFNFRLAHMVDFWWTSGHWNRFLLQILHYHSISAPYPYFVLLPSTLHNFANDSVIK